MKCPDCGSEMLLLFFSAECTRCSGIPSWETAWVVLGQPAIRLLTAPGGYAQMSNLSKTREEAVNWAQGFPTQPLRILRVFGRRGTGPQFTLLPQKPEHAETGIFWIADPQALQ